jgi:hypothetical protein
MASNAGARMLLVFGFLAAWIGYDAYLASHVMFDPGSTRAAAHALLQTHVVQRDIANDITKELDNRLPAAAKDPRTAAAIKTALHDPRVTNAFADTLARIHEQVLSGGNSTSFTIDGRAITSALHDALAKSDPQLAAQIKQVPPLTVAVGHRKLPNLHDPRSTANVVAVLGIVAALLFITASLILRHDRRAIALVGRRITYLAIMPLVVFVVLPRLLSHASGDAPQVASALFRVYGDRVLPSAITLAVVGLAIFFGAFLMPRFSAEDSPTPNGRRTRPPTPPRPSSGPDQPAITEKMYL